MDLLPGTAVAAHAVEMTTIAETLRHDHEQLERLFAELTNAVDGADSVTIQQVWSRFEQALMAHFEAEESSLLPAVEKQHPEEARQIRAEHDSMRRLVHELGLRADIHALRKDVADQLVAKLREHAQREEKTLYRWADELDGARLLGAIVQLLKNRQPRGIRGSRAL